MIRLVNPRTKKSGVYFQMERTTVWALAIGFALYVTAVAAGTGWGNGYISPPDVLRTIFGSSQGEYDFIIMTLRLPRVLTALLVGSALGVSGAILQGVIRNPLASPDIIGITGGASAAAVAFITFLSGSVSIKLLPAAAVAGALIVSLLVYGLSWKKGVTPIRLVLIGIGLSAAAKAATTLMIVMSPAISASKAYLWMTGSVYGASWDNVLTVLPAVLAGIPLALYFARSLNAQELGDDVAGSLGVTVQRHRFVLVLISVALAGFAVSVAGAVGFIGLIAPHLARRWTGRLFGGLLVMSALTGGLLVFLADLIARTLFYPLDIPAGVFTAGIGAPFFIYMLFRNRNQW
ncbi:FecCD family ABC transporter permease [Paenibacillus riograndensis]|uniref:Transport system permease n=3 Tax=Paenibacillus sonchi group TaxID=2044880 RepID=A0A0E3WGY7_9BACL|nr:iron ABC transporter permease [Paenibacillus riograndensis]CQR54358.1 transport system permease [Paenibacillus riograndensis SBR5]